MKAWFIPLALFGLAVAAQADDTPAPNARQACRADYQKFCSGVPRSGGRALDCLNSHKGDLSTACQEAIAKLPPKDSATTPDQPPKSE
jgi:hypothetical protein